MAAQGDGERDAGPDDEVGPIPSHIGELRPASELGDLSTEAVSAALENESLDELAIESEDELDDSGERPTGGNTGVHRRASLPPPVPAQALSQRPSRAPTVPPPAAGGTGVHRVPPPPPPPMPANFAALRSQLQRVNGRCHELLCERARLEKQLAARDRALDALRLQNADLVRTRSDAHEVLVLRRELADLRARMPDTSPSAPTSVPVPSVSEEELAALRADRAALISLRAELEEVEAMRIELQRLRETQADVERLRAEHTELMSLRRERDDSERLRERVAELEAARQSLFAELETLRVKAVGVGPTLANISGIGPTFARRLERLSIDVAAIAAWDDADVERIAKVIRTQPARIHRQGWVAQARALIE